MAKRTFIAKGTRLGKLTVLYQVKKPNKWSQILYMVRCDCGAPRYTVRAWDLVSAGDNCVKSCRTCASQQQGFPKKYKREYCSWTSMRSRCCHESDVGYEYYGGRGITVCPEWLGPGGFIRFLQDMGRRPANMTLDRENVQGPYCKSNCRWATSKEQNNNTRRNYTEEELTALQAAASDTWGIDERF